MIRLAELSDIEHIMSIIGAVCQEMRLEGNDQWDEDYPRENDFLNDIQRKELYVNDNSGIVSGFLCINYIEPEEYTQINWSSNIRPMVLHRMAVAPAFRRQGIASMLFQFAEKFAQNKEVNYLRSDTNSLNTKMNALFRKQGYSIVGQMPAFGKKSLFNFYDKILQVQPETKS